MNKDTRNEEKFSPEEEIQLINQMIEQTKKDTADSGWPLLLWGWLAFSCCILVYVFVFVGIPEYSFLPWAILMPIGGIVHFIKEFRGHKEQRILTYSEKAIGWLWIACGTAMFIIGFVAAPTCIIGREAISPLIALIIGIGTLVTAKIINWKLMFYGSLLWWITAILLMFIPANYQNMVFGLVIIPAYLVPGYILRKNYKNK